MSFFICGQITDLISENRKQIWRIFQWINNRALTNCGARIMIFIPLEVWKCNRWRCNEYWTGLSVESKVESKANSISCWSKGGNKYQKSTYLPGKVHFMFLFCSSFNRKSWRGVSFWHSIFGDCSTETESRPVIFITASTIVWARTV